MPKAKISFTDEQLKFIRSFSELGLKNRSFLVRFAVDNYRKSIKRQELISLAVTYAGLLKR